MEKGPFKKRTRFTRKKDQNWRLVPVRGALEIILIYIVVGVAWIFLSDYLLSLFISDDAVLQDLQLAKGIFYVVMTAGLFYWIIKKRMDLYVSSIIKLQKTNLELKRTNDTMTTLETQLYDLAYFDQLTRLPNRNRLEEAIRLDIKENPEAHLRVVYLDIDNFRLINEVKGFAAGDLLLQKIAREMEELVKPPHQVFRYGGNQFVFLLRGIASRDVFMELIAHYTRETKRSLMLGNEEYFYSLSSGVSSYPEDGSDYDQLMQHAEMALKMSKFKGPGGVVVYEPRFAKIASERIELNNMLQGALANGEMFLNFQPIYSVNQKRLVAFEALIRWKHPKRGLIPPMDFIPTAEKTGQIAELTRFVVDGAVAFEKRLQSQGYDNIDVTVNFSSKLILIEDMLDYVNKSLAYHQIDSGRLVFEITETILLENMELAFATLKKLRQAGFRIALDDFGTGYSSLQYLDQLPLDILKIDRSFIMAADEKTAASPLVNFMLDLGHRMGLKVVAEGIETAYQKDMLVDFGIDGIQGYLYSKPLSEKDALSFVEGHTGTHRLP
ncbi:MAG: EAL domain-containing protein [Bacilli bacterium]|jgi:diguanylate cyclase (GGDEF)-like protein